MQTRSAGTARLCSICLDRVVVQVLVEQIQGHIDSCKHEFCFSCIKKWSEVLYEANSRLKTVVQSANNHLRASERDVVASTTMKNGRALPRRSK